MISLIVLFIIVIVIAVLYKNSNSAIIKKVLIIVPSLTLIVTIFFVKVKIELNDGFPYGKTETLETILNVSLENAIIPKELQDKKLKKYKTSDIGSTAHLSSFIGDKNGNVIASVIFLGNRDLVKINGVLYQIQE